ncbi:MAG: hypothetical protein SCARUB_01203 [Candidatus Scalindua rubra]|uniref:Uncharacterized protein n=1 Tax=Candidatus Scalindua rubra TaxID=1872076 RepID=A0A1E3XDJ6_9BACT|nr:MAG: hypothetical protein SCARUB_01203 [Candidatus Scalindua rubra]
MRRNIHKKIEIAHRNRRQIPPKPHYGTFPGCYMSGMADFHSPAIQDMEQGASLICLSGIQNMEIWIEAHFRIYKIRLFIRKHLHLESQTGISRRILS